MKDNIKEIKTKSYTLKDDEGDWLGQVVLSSDGMFASVTHYGNFSYAWRYFGGDFRGFIYTINVEYFANKMFVSLSSISTSKKCENACKIFAEEVLPRLQQALEDEISNNEDW